LWYALFAATINGGIVGGIRGKYRRSMGYTIWLEKECATLFWIVTLLVKSDPVIHIFDDMPIGEDDSERKIWRCAICGQRNIDKAELVHTSGCAYMRAKAYEEALLKETEV
jgi:hypothetical protein